VSKRIVLVDGYNLIRNDPALKAIEARSLDAGRRALVSRLMTTFDLRSNEITVVFDGANAPALAPASERYGQVRVVYSRQGETADAVLGRLVAATPPGRQVVLLSDDHALRDVARQHGAVVGGAADRTPSRPTPSDLAARDRDALDRRTEKKGNPRRAKKRSRRTHDVRW
jgi:predicted RNA-binding protein with PIN domain